MRTTALPAKFAARPPNATSRCPRRLSTRSSRRRPRKQQLRKVPRGVGRRVVFKDCSRHTWRGLASFQTRMMMMMTTKRMCSPSSIRAGRVRGHGCVRECVDGGGYSLIFQNNSEYSRIFQIILDYFGEYLFTGAWRHWHGQLT